MIKMIKRITCTLWLPKKKCVIRKYFITEWKKFFIYKKILSGSTLLYMQNQKQHLNNHPHHYPKYGLLHCPLQNYPHQYLAPAPIFVADVELAELSMICKSYGGLTE